MARKRRERNISYDEDRGMFYVTLNFGLDPETGKQVKKTKTFRTLSQARAALRKHEAARDAGQVVMPKDLSLHRWLDIWMKNVVELNRAATTVYAYEQMIKNHIAPALGDIPLQKLTPQNLQKYYADKAREGKISSNTVRKHHDLLSAALRAAVRQGEILSNPAERVEPPKVKISERDFYSPGEVKALLQVPMDGWLRVGVHLAAYLGLRREEICGLRWSCVDFENHLVKIRYARTSAGSKLVEKEPKNRSSERVLTCPSELETVLKEELIHQEKWKDIRVSPQAQEGFVVCWPDGEPVRPNYLSNRFSKLVSDNNLPKLTLHGLRHSFASIANAQGASLFDIGKALGHSTPSTTGKIYTHLIEQTHEKTVSCIAQAINASGKDAFQSAASIPGV